MVCALHRIAGNDPAGGAVLGSELVARVGYASKRGELSEANMDLLERTDEMATEARKPACFNCRCIACGPDNEHGLQLSFQITDAGVSASWVPTEDWASYPDTIHGGIVTTVLDEAMSKAVIATGIQAFTMELTVRFHQAVRPGRWYSVEG
jgi:hypothetical protein